MKINFREVEKEQLNAQVPVDLSTVLRERAARRRWSITKTVTEALAIGLGVSPSEYGIEAEKQTA